MRRWPGARARRNRAARASALTAAALTAALVTLTACSGTTGTADPPGPTSAAPAAVTHVSVPALPPADPSHRGAAAEDPEDPADPGNTSSVDPADRPAGVTTQVVFPALPDPPPTVTVNPAAGSSAVNPTAPITVIASHGTLTSVALVNPAEHLTVKGALSADGTSWHVTQPLGYSKSYRLTATATSPDGQTVTETSAFTTLTPHNMTMPYLDYTGGYPLTAGATYGVGIVPVVHFDEPIANKAAAQAALHVTTTPAVAGSWYWADDQNVHYRPKGFWPAGTKVTVSADVYGVEVGPGLYGQSDMTTSFTIGRRQVTVADDNAPKVDKVIVYDGAGKAIRTMNTSMGKHGGVTVNGKYINFYTPAGTYTVLAHTNPEMMSSASYGLPADAPGGYAPEPIYYSTRISTDGIFLHELENTVWAQNHGLDVSHGCLNLNKANAIWFYTHSLIGDPVVVHGAKGAPRVTLWEGGDWSVPWPTWHAGSAQ